MSIQRKSKLWLKLVCLVLPLLYPWNVCSRFLTLHVANKLLKRIKGYQIAFDDIRITWSGFRLYGFQFKSAQEDLISPIFIKIKLVEIGLNKAALWKGFIGCQVFVEEPVCEFRPEKNGKLGTPKLPAIPFVIESFELVRGQIEFIDPNPSSDVRVKAESINLSCQNITNMQAAEELPCKADIAASICDGTISATAKFSLNNLAFDLNTEIKNINLVRLNSLFITYGKFKVQQGIMDIFIEAAAANGKFKGYVKPLIQHLELSDEAQQPDGIITWFKKIIIEAFNGVFENPEEEQVGTKIPFGGTFRNPEINVFWAILETIYNGFICALKPSIDYEINIRSVKK